MPNLCNDHLKHLGTHARQMLLYLINASWQSGVVLREWHRVIIIVPFPRQARIPIPGQAELGIPACLNTWVWSFLRDRRACVDVNGTKSSERVYMAGLPQGSVLSPTLFFYGRPHSQPA